MIPKSMYFDETPGAAGQKYAKCTEYFHIPMSFCSMILGRMFRASFWVVQTITEQCLKPKTKREPLEFHIN